MGGFENEANALAALDTLLMEYSHVFSVHHEVEGRLLHHRANTEGSGKVIIDRILVPKRPLISAGWTLGPIGIEAKRSSAKGLGKAIAQAQDYSRAAFQMPESFCCATIVLQWVFLWPVESMFGHVASIAAQSRIGAAKPWKGGLRFDSNSQGLIKLYAGCIECMSPTTGQKIGNRGAAKP
jgi:hypothetical protein